MMFPVPVDFVTDFRTPDNATDRDSFRQFHSFRQLRLNLFLTVQLSHGDGYERIGNMQPPMMDYHDHCGSLCTPSSALPLALNILILM